MDKMYMKAAAFMASMSSEKGIGGPFGAIIVDKDDQIVASGVNRVLERNDPTAHAEMEAIRNASKVRENYDLSDCTIYTTGFPCPMCLSAIMWSGINTVYFGTSMDEAKALGFQDEDMYLKFKTDQFGVNFEQIKEPLCVDIFKHYKENQGTIY